MGDFTKANLLADAKLIIGSFPVFTGENSVDNDQITLSIDQALVTYSMSLPHDRAQVVAAVDGQFFYPLNGNDAVVDAWDDDFSGIREVDLRTPSGGRATATAGSVESIFPQNVASNGYDVFKSGDAQFLRFTGAFATPIDGEYFEVHYTSLHQIVDGTDAANTIPGKHRHAITFLTVSRLASIAAIRAVKALDPPGGAEFVTMRTKDKGFQMIAKDYYEKYIEEIGGQQPIAASIVVDAPLEHTLSIYGFYGHRSRNVTVSSNSDGSR